MDGHLVRGCPSDARVELITTAGSVVAECVLPTPIIGVSFGDGAAACSDRFAVLSCRRGSGEQAQPARGEHIDLLVYDRRLRLAQTVPVLPQPSAAGPAVASETISSVANDSGPSEAPIDFLASVFSVADRLLVVTQTIVHTSSLWYRTKEFAVTSVPSAASESGRLASRTVRLRPWLDEGVGLGMVAGYGRLLVTNLAGQLYCFAGCGAMLWSADLRPRLGSTSASFSAIVNMDETAIYLVRVPLGWDETGWTSVWRLSFDEPRHHADRWRRILAEDLVVPASLAEAISHGTDT
eukprot:TRINITY_DN358_c0_g2_i4.p1 TRINITY_DN358_c0_g2~~TRINITY_DN358_c0_g2_i4.p1  ORF type:complete len:295 (+),score=60.10 TRINITY_DN358_c0_g2_i4:485-1369(+)